MPAPAIIHDLVRRFEDSRELYRSGKYNEAQLRVEFLNPFFKALGWDVDNERNYAPQYREVIVEDSLQIEDSAKAPDYAFCLGGQRKFFVEAKKPAVDIKYDIHPAFQLRRYGWNKHLPLSILTDFEEFAVYDCRNKPDPHDSAATARLMLLSFNEYVERWDELAGLFSPQAILSGAFDRYVVETKGKKGTTEVDDAFLKDIEAWRDLLARNIALRNRASGLTERQLNYAVQMTIDRIIFLRICEDRSLEPEEKLLSLTHTPAIYPALLDLFRHADEKYNSGLFHFSTEKSQTTSADSFTPGLQIDDKVLKEIIRGMYYPCPYIFKEIPVEILGQVYEQFLGKVIRLTPGGQAKVEEKPEVRKAGGVYYTPRYIVDYIVKNTVGKLLESKTPAEASELKVVDPACGSGSFLLGAYQYLLDWHEQYYLEHDPESFARGKSPALVPMGAGVYRLSTAERKRILVNNIYGVDIDAQAVEVTKLSLLLKLLEQESGQLTLGFERVLPDLGRNIRCGNSLIGWDYFKGQLMPDQAEVERVNPFDWQREFPQVFAQGGFDAVIGNPPYVRQESLGLDKQYYQSSYEVFTGTADLYSYFIEKGIKLLAPGGQFSYIVANKWLRANYGLKLRQWLKTKNIEEITDFGDLPVFTSATTYPLILRVSNNPLHHHPWVTSVATLEFPSLEEYVQAHGDAIDQTRFEDEGWSLAGHATQNLLEKLRQNSILLGEYVHGKIYRGILTGLNKAFVIDQPTKDRLIAEDPRSAEVIKPFIVGRNIQRFRITWDGSYLIFTKRGIKCSNYPAIIAYLNQFKDELIPKPTNWKGGQWNGRKPGPYKWYEIQDTVAYHEEFEKPKITWGNLAQKPKFTMDSESYYVNAPSVIVPVEDYYLLGVLNSSLCYFFIAMTAAGRQGGFFEYKPLYVSKMPIHVVDENIPNEVKIKQQIELLVQRELMLNKQGQVTEQDKVQTERALAATDIEIDRLVYKLYGLTTEEVTIVEGMNS